MRPVVWTPPRPRTVAPTALCGSPKVLPISGRGPEDVVLDRNGDIMTGVEDGRILRVRADGRRLDTLADTGGRPLGIERTADGGMVVCDSERGLLRLVARDAEEYSVEVLVESSPSGLALCNNAAVAADGTIYFSDSTHRFPLSQWRGDLMEHGGTGRLLRRDPTGEVEVVLTGLQFANGVALAPDESFVVVAETGAYRLTRLWLRGDRAGHRDVLLDGLAGFPDNIATGSDGLIWVALPSSRSGLLDRLHPLPPVLRRMAWATPQAMQPGPDRVLWLLGVDMTGAVRHEIRADAGTYHMVTGVREHSGTLYLGSLEERAVATLPVPTAYTSAT